MSPQTFKSSLYGCPLQRPPRDPLQTTSFNRPYRNCKHLEIMISEHDLLPLSSSSILDVGRLLYTIQPFRELKTVTLVMGFKRQTDVEELCLSQELEGIQMALNEFLTSMPGRRRGMPVIRVQWLWPVKDESWRDFGSLYGIE